MTDDRDIILITVDCWRHDAPAQMPRTRELLSEFESGEAICQAAATNDAFPTILSSQYFCDAYQDPNFDTVDDETVSLPKLLGEAGYETSAFLASNPFLGKWADHFDTFWNDGMRDQDETENRSEYTQFDRIKNLLQLEHRVMATDVAARAREWFEQGESPRFLWMHLMDTHGPYYPGLRRGMSTGLIDSYRSLIQFSREGMDASDSVLETITELYWQCVDRLDEQMEAVLGFLPDDATVLVMADHGEEFDHGYIGHARLYDETVRVPLYVKHPEFELTAPVRQIDLAPTVAEWAVADIPTQWVGEPYTGTARDSFQVNRSIIDGEKRVYLGLRTPEEKLIQIYDDNGEQITTEYYDLVTDPSEREPVTEIGAEQEEIADRLASFDRRNNITEQILAPKPEATEAVQQRLEELGYR